MEHNNFKYFNYFKDTSLIRGKNESVALEALKKPSIFRIKGSDSTRSVLISVLIHGHEICGFRAFLNVVNKANKYKYDIYFLVGNIFASKIKPLFSYRNVPGGQNFNRVWTCEDPQTIEEKTAREIKEFLTTLPLTGFLDIHSFTGKSMVPHSFICALDSRSKETASKLTEHVFLFDQNMGMTIHAMESSVPSLIVECGTNGTKEADVFANETLDKFLIEMNLVEGEIPVLAKEVHSDMTSIRLHPETKPTWSNREEPLFDITIRQDIEDLNLKPVAAEALFGWGQDLSVFMIKKNGRSLNPETVFGLRNEQEIYFKNPVFPTLMSTQEHITKESGFYFFNQTVATQMPSPTNHMPKRSKK